MLTWLEISKSALIHNLKQFRKIISPEVKIMGVIKSNAYGHGLIGVAKILEKYIDYFGVASLDEALVLRKNGFKKPILILTYWDLTETDKIQQAITERIDFALYTYPQVKILSNLSQKIGKRVRIHLKIDTGTSRIGILPKNALNFALKCFKLPGLELEGIFTHFAKSEAYYQKYTLLQTQRLIKTVQEISQKISQKTILYNNLRNRNVLSFTAIAGKNKTKLPLIHAACTAATIVNPATHLDMVRIGLGLYGLWPSSETKKLAQQLGRKIDLKPALTWKTRVIQVKELPAGTPIGYDCTYRLKKKGKIAVLPVGYWDGYDRKLSNCGEVLIKGRRIPIRGRICMNLTMVEVTKVSDVKEGDAVVLIGRQGQEEITPEELAEKVGTINYEIVTRINPLLPRIYR
ncbi:MAG: alanine racemase [Patescibacteria group bacterium]|nr:alanine racemase [Patescibacteria group bacterium]